MNLVDAWRAATVHLLCKLCGPVPGYGRTRAVDLCSNVSGVCRSKHLVQPCTKFRIRARTVLEYRRLDSRVGAVRRCAPKGLARTKF